MIFNDRWLLNVWACGCVNALVKHLGVSRIKLPRPTTSIILNMLPLEFSADWYIYIVLDHRINVCMINLSDIFIWLLFCPLHDYQNNLWYTLSLIPTVHYVTIDLTCDVSVIFYQQLDYRWYTNILSLLCTCMSVVLLVLWFLLAVGFLNLYGKVHVKHLCISRLKCSRPPKMSIILHILPLKFGAGVH